MFLVNSRRRLVSATRFRPDRDGVRAPLIPKLRGQFAEFLEGTSPERLRLLTQPICVDLRYGQPRFNGYDVVSWQSEVTPVGEAKPLLPITPQAYEGRICQSLALGRLEEAIQSLPGAILLRHALASTRLAQEY